MYILTENNIPFSMDNIPSVIDDIRYCVLDYSAKEESDYYCIPLVFLESFTSPSADIQIGPYRLQMPLDWSIVIGEKEIGDLEVIQLTQCLDRDFTVFCYNPLKGYRPEYHVLEILNIYPDVKWHVPKLKHGHLLSLPLERTINPLCCFIVKDTHKLPDVLDLSRIM